MVVWPVVAEERHFQHTLVDLRYSFYMKHVQQYKVTSIFVYRVNKIL